MDTGFYAGTMLCPLLESLSVSFWLTRNNEYANTCVHVYVYIYMYAYIHT